MGFSAKETQELGKYNVENLYRLGVLDMFVIH